MWQRKGIRRVLQTGGGASDVPQPPRAVRLLPWHDLFHAPLRRTGSPRRRRRAIVVHYRLTRFWRTQSGAHGVESTDFGTGLHHVRYLVPVPVAADDRPSDLVGASLAADLYPYRYYLQLQALWSSLFAVLPARATRVVVTVDVDVDVSLLAVTFSSASMNF